MCYFQGRLGFRQTSFIYDFAVGFLDFEILHHSAIRQSNSFLCASADFRALISLCKFIALDNSIERQMRTNKFRFFFFEIFYLSIFINLK